MTEDQLEQDLLGRLAEVGYSHCRGTVRANQGKAADAAIELQTAAVRSIGLNCEAAPELPHFPEHGVILGWPAGDGDEEKAARLALRNDLAVKATAVHCCPGQQTEMLSNEAE